MTPSDTAHPEGEIVDVLKSTRNVLANSMDGDFSLWSSPTFTRPRIAAWAALKGLEAAIKLLSAPPSRPQGEEGLWRPISEAPTTGVRIVGMNPLWAEDRRVRVVWWVDNGPGLDEGQYWQDDADSEPDPEYWQPLPALSNQGKPSS